MGGWKAENHIGQDNGIAHRERIVERVFVQPRTGVVQSRTLVAGQIKTFGIEGGQHARIVRPLVTDLQADKPDTAGV
jgi:hypothetical protein